MGFNNKGVDYLVEQVKVSCFDGVLGINIGKNKDMLEENVLDDYLICLNKVYVYVSYIIINILLFNMFGFRNLQYGVVLELLFSGLKEVQ